MSKIIGKPHIVFLTILCFGLVTYLAAGVAGALDFSDPQHTEAIQERLQDIQKKYKNPALNIGVVYQGNLVLNQAYGVMDLKTNEPVPEDAIYQIASVTKTLVSALAASMMDDGLIDLDKPVGLYASRLDFHNADWGAKVTLRTLLTHKSGLPGNPVNRVNIPSPDTFPEGMDATIAKPYSIDEFYIGVKSTPFVFEPGTADRYSNMGYNIAGHVLARAGGYKNLAEALADRVFGPLGMKDSQMGLDEEAKKRSPTPYVYSDDPSIKGGTIGKRQYYQAPYWQFGEATGGAGVSSTVEDLAKYVAYLMMVDEHSDDIISYSSVQKLLTPDHQYIYKSGSVYERGLGWQIAEFGSYGTIYQHNGHNDGHHAFVVFSREHQIGIVILTNGAHAGMDILGNRLFLYFMNQIAGDDGPGELISK